MDTIKEHQADIKSSRQTELDKIKSLDTQLKAKINEQKAAKARIPYKSSGEIEEEIQRLEILVDSGKLKLVDDRKTLHEISMLNKQLRAFQPINHLQSDIDTLKTQISMLKSTEDKVGARELQQQFDRTKKQLDDLHVARKEASKETDAALETLRRARAAHDEAWQDLRQYKDAFHKAKKEFHDSERELNKARDAKRRAEHEAYVRSKRQEALERKLEEASMPAYGDEIRASESIMRVVDPSSVPTTTSATVSGLAAKPSRVVDPAGLKGTVLSKKDDNESYFVGGGGKKGRKGKKGRAVGVDGASSSSAAGRDTLTKLWAPGSIEQFEKIGVEPPSNPDDIPHVLDKVGEKRDFFLKDRDRKTEEVSEPFVTASLTFDTEARH